MINQRGDIRHSFILWWIALFVCWQFFSFALVSAQIDSVEFGVKEINMSEFNSNLTGDNIDTGLSLIDSLVAFHLDNAFINIIFIITGAFAIWVVASVFAGVGG